jgi:hypothetical protein
VNNRNGRQISVLDIPRRSGDLISGSVEINAHAAAQRRGDVD